MYYNQRSCCNHCYGCCCSCCGYHYYGCNCYKWNTYKYVEPIVVIKETKIYPRRQRNVFDVLGMKARG